MTPTEYAAYEISIWEAALEQHREVAARQLDLARRKGPRGRVIALIPQVEALRTKADLLLAEAVKVKCTFRDDRIMMAWFTSEQPLEVAERAGD